MIFGLFRRRKSDGAVAFYASIVAQARLRDFYARFEVPDTPTGRFDMIVMHLFLVFHRFGKEEGAVQQFGQEVFDLFLADMDANLREIGIADLRVPKKMKKLGEVFYGRSKDYAVGMESGDRGALAAALENNLYADSAPAPEITNAIAGYMLDAASGLSTQSTQELMSGEISWISAPAMAS